MDRTSLNNLWTYLEGALTAEDWAWIDARRGEPTSVGRKVTDKKETKHLHISTKRKKIMETIKISPKNYKYDEKAQHILDR